MADQLATNIGGYQNSFHLGRAAEYLQYGERFFEAFHELANDHDLIGMIEESVAPIAGWKTKKFQSLFDFRLYRILLYALVRAKQPALMIETGILHGMTTIFLLRAMEQNGTGRLLSVDLPSYADSGPANKDGYFATLPEGCEPGWIVPEDKYTNWQLEKRSSRDVLPLLQADDLDVFLHDSEHTFSTMWFELDWAWERLRPGGILICDNIEASTAFGDIARRYGKFPLYFPSPDRSTHEAPRFGLIVKG